MNEQIFQVGDRVIVAKKVRGGFGGFNSEMDRYLGKEFSVIECVGPYGGIMCYQLDGTDHWYFRGESLQFASAYWKHHQIAREICRCQK